MATVNIGNIKFNWKGPWSNATTYAVDDVVSLSGSSYISIQAGSNQNPASASAYWQQMSSAGTNGTNGTDLTSTLTTQGDIVYRDGSGLARLGYGTNGQVLTTGGSGANPSWGTVSSDYVKIASGNLNTGSSAHTIDNVFTSGTYKIYKVYFTNFNFATGNHHFGVRMVNTDGSVNTSSVYSYIQEEKYRNSGSNNGTQAGNWNGTYWKFGEWNVSDDSNTEHKTSIELTMYDPMDSTARLLINYQGNQWEQNATYFVSFFGAGVINSSTKQFRGINIHSGASHNFASGTYAVYGIKH